MAFANLLSGAVKSIIYSLVSRTSFAVLLPSHVYCKPQCTFSLSTSARIKMTKINISLRLYFLKIKKIQINYFSYFFHENGSIGNSSISFSWIYNRSNFIIFYEFAKVLISLLFLKELMKVLVSFFFSFFFFYTKNLRKQYFHYYLSWIFSTSNLFISFFMKLQISSDFTLFMR